MLSDSACVAGESGRGGEPYIAYPKHSIALTGERHRLIVPRENFIRIFWRGAAEGYCQFKEVRKKTQDGERNWVLRHSRGQDPSQC